MPVLLIGLETLAPRKGPVRVSLMGRDGRPCRPQPLGNNLFANWVVVLSSRLLPFTSRDTSKKSSHQHPCINGRKKRINITTAWFVEQEMAQGSQQSTAPHWSQESRHCCLGRKAHTLAFSALKPASGFLLELSSPSAGSTGNRDMGQTGERPRVTSPGRIMEISG